MTLSAAIHAAARPASTTNTPGSELPAGDVKVFYMDRAICHFQYVFVPRFAEHWAPAAKGDMPPALVAKALCANAGSTQGDLVRSRYRRAEPRDPGELAHRIGYRHRHSAESSYLQTILSSSHQVPHFCSSRWKESVNVSMNRCGVFWTSQSQPLAGPDRPDV